MVRLKRIAPFLMALGILFLLAVLWQEPISAQVMEFNFDGNLNGLVGGERLTARPGEGARFVQSVEGQGIEPDEDAAVVIPVPEGILKRSGTIAFRLRPSRTIRISPAPDGKPLSAPIVQCPLFDIVLSELKRHPRLEVTVRLAGGKKLRGQIFLSHLKGGQWYHLAFAWDANSGRLEMYLNGVLQQYLIRGFPKPEPWEPTSPLSGELRLGGRLGSGDIAAKIAVDSLQLWQKFMSESEVRATLKGRDIAALAGEGRTNYEGALDLSKYNLELIYEADFNRPLNVVMEDDLFEGEKRVRTPDGYEWVFEGPGRAWTEGGKLHIESFKPKEQGHVVLWNTRVFPESFLLEFGFSPEDSLMGLNIIFFCATTLDGGDIFGLGVPRRGGIFKNYHSGALNCYHISYWAVAQTGVPRRTANLRKNYGFFLPSCGIDRIAGEGAGPHRVRLLKVGNKIRLETRNRLSLVYDDDGKTYGPVWGTGRIGLRQMGHTHKATYTHFKVWRVTEK